MSERITERARVAEAQLRDANVGLFAELLGFLANNKKWWLLPIVAVLLILGLLVLLSGSAAAPFIYTLF
jgi:hypothetical protein